MLGYTAVVGLVSLHLVCASILQKRECQPNQIGSGPSVVPDTPSAFLAYQPFAEAATNATTPPGYLNTFNNMQSESQTLGFDGYFLLDSYNTTECAAMCDARYGCMAFNLAFERQPMVSPGPDCSNPNSTTWIKCTLWQGAVNTDNAINSGQWSYNFEVVTAGSNGYVNATIMDATGYGAPQALVDQAVLAPLDCNGKNTLLATTYWNDSRFDSQRCGVACTAQSGCQFFNTYMMIFNYIEVIQACAMYTETWEASYATAPTVTYAGNTYTVTKSFGYSNATNPGFCIGQSYTALGCYGDQGGARSLGYRATVPSGTQLTLDVCSCLCTNYTYFGTEYGSECYCGNSFSQAQANGPADNCNMGCAGNSAQACGGSWALNIYQQTGVKPALCGAILQILGCYHYQNYLYEEEDDFMTVEQCSCTCAFHQYFALYRGIDCYCGDSLNNNVAPGLCTSVCSGNYSEICGGPNAVTIGQVNPSYVQQHKQQCGV